MCFNPPKDNPYFYTDFFISNLQIILINIINDDYISKKRGYNK